MFDFVIFALSKYSGFTLLTLFDMGFFDPSVMGGGGGGA